jgi:hypothetical protein
MEFSAEQIARVCHDANRALALASGEDPATVWPSWDDAPASIQESAIVGVQHALEGATPEQLHESWLETKRRDGWTFGEVRDNDAKRHPCLVPYHELPEQQKTKDDLFVAIVNTLELDRLDQRRQRQPQHGGSSMFEVREASNDGVTQMREVVNHELRRARSAAATPRQGDGRRVRCERDAEASTPPRRRATTCLGGNYRGPRRRCRRAA